jgi:cytochrome P450
MPLVESIQFLTGYRKYVARYVEQYGCPIFKAHPGVETVLVTDHTSVKAAFAMGPDKLDRDGTVAFGPVRVHYEDMLRGCIPALMSDQKRHTNRRKLIEEVLAIPSTQQRFQQVVEDYVQKSWPFFRQDLNSTQELEFACFHAANTFVMKWLFDIEGADGQRMSQWTDQAMGLRSDRWLSHSLGKLAKVAPSKEIVDWSEAEMRRIQESEPFQNFYRDIGAKYGFPPEETAAHLLWASHFNASGGIHGTLLPTVCMMANQADMRRKLLEELEHFNTIIEVKEEGAVDIAKELDQFPYLNAFCNEAFRFFGRPKHYYRKAQTDIVLPTSDGKRVQVPKGTVLGLVSFTARQDPTVFLGPEKFSPQRYLDNPDLEGDIFSMGPPAGTDGAAYNCAAAADRWALRAFKTTFVSFLRKYGTGDASLEPFPIMDMDAKVGINDKQTIMLHVKR